MRNVAPVDERCVWKVMTIGEVRNEFSISISRRVETCMTFADYEVPVAYSMVTLAAQLSAPSSHPVQGFVCYWAAFNNIYVTIADKEGRRAQLRRNRDGSLRTRAVGCVNIPEVSPMRERDQIDLAFLNFTDKLKHELVDHPNTRFFVYRTPYWRGQPIENDATGQRLNGVLNVGYTLDAALPIWAPIDTIMFEKYSEVARDSETRDALARQVLDMLYIVRNNAFHGGKRADDANDREVLEKALPLLAMIVCAFLRT
ncbi:MAG: hypothetical protein H7Y42_08990 [Chitinophagaceae bacterium]|nr:hypothetical protein [Chitinophagaceae bacterium]